MYHPIAPSQFARRRSIDVRASSSGSLVSEADELGVEARLHFSRSQLLTSQQKRTSRQRLVSPDTTRSDTVSPPRLITFGFEASHPDPVRAERLRTVYTSQFKKRVLNEMHGQVSHLHSGVNPSTPIRLGAPVLTLYQSERLSSSAWSDFHSGSGRQGHQRDRTWSPSAASHLGPEGLLKIHRRNHSGTGMQLVQARFALGFAVVPGEIERPCSHRTPSRDPSAR